jgi:hypothetical protein
MLMPTPIEQLRRPHPDQERIDAEAARLLTATANRPGGVVPDQELRRRKSRRPEAGSKI